MRRFSTVLATAMLLSSFNVFAAEGGAGKEQTGFDERYCTESALMKRMPMRCVACGIQNYNSKKGETKRPSERQLAIMAAAARSFRELNPGNTTRGNDNPARHDVAAQNLQRILITQIQAYGYCEDNGTSDLAYLRNFITNDRDLSDSEIAEAATNIGIAGFRESTKIENFKTLFNDSARRTLSLEDRRKAFSAILDDVPKRYSSKKSASKYLKNTDDGWMTSDCLDEMRETMNRPAIESRDLCMAMVNSCQLESELCGVVGQQPPSGQTREQTPRQPQPTGGGTRPTTAPPGSVR